MENCQHPRDVCYLCETAPADETHHIFPQRFGGGDIDENLVDLCEDCHRKLERLYGEKFWGKIDISKATNEPYWEDENVVEIEVPREEIDRYEPACCAQCERKGPFRKRTHQPSGYPAYICARCEGDGWPSSVDESPVHLMVPEDE